MTAAQPYRALRIVLFALSALEGIAGLVFLFATGWVVNVLIPSLGLVNVGFIMYMLKGLGIVALAFGYLLCVAARYPVRYAAVVDIVAYSLVAAAVLNVYALAVMGLGALYPPAYVIARAVLQVILAVVLLWLRPRGASAAAAT